MLSQLAEQQLVLLLLTMGGFILFKAGFIPKAGIGSIINITLYLFMPCNILYSFLVTFDSDRIMSFLSVFLVAVFIQVVSLVISKYFYNRAAPEKQAVLRFATVNSNSILLGAPIAESIYGGLGMSYASIYTIPARFVMWSAGLAYFTKPPGKAALIKSSLTHPCMIAVVLGFICVPLHISLPSAVMTVLRDFGACTTPVSMLIIGVTLAEVKFGELAEKAVFYLSFIRLGLLPFMAYAVCLLFRLNAEVTGISVLLTAMPAGATTTIMAAKYNGNGAFASKCVVLSTLLSFVSTAAWSLIVNG
ncbi:MAG: AEC family transporter [Spirochaetales bacterium]|nr:AEC family transporter [Spirochaetales bacterium]